MAELPAYPGSPRWVKVSGTIVGVLMLVVVILMLAGVGGPHGPGRHTLDDDTPPLGHRRARQPTTMIMAPGLRKFALCAHVSSSVGSVGAVTCFLVLAVAGLSSKNVQTVRAVYLAMELTAWFAIIPLVIASLLTGLVQSLGTTWGLFRHYWVLVKFLVTVLVTVVLLLQMEGIGHVAEVAAEKALSGSDLIGLRRSIRTHAVGGLLVLLAPVALSLYKPRGMTKYGWRKHYENHVLSAPS